MLIKTGSFGIGVTGDHLDRELAQATPLQQGNESMTKGVRRNVALPFVYAHIPKGGIHPPANRPGADPGTVIPGHNTILVFPTTHGFLK